MRTVQIDFLSIGSPLLRTSTELCLCQRPYAKGLAHRCLEGPKYVLKIGHVEISIFAEVLLIAPATVELAN